MQGRLFGFSLFFVPFFIFCKQPSGNSFLEISDKIAQEAKSELGKNLTGAIQNKGLVGAIEFCNQKAIPLTNDSSKSFNVSLKRVSDKPRNSQNEANSEEKKVIEKFKTQLLNKEKLTPIISETTNNLVGYFPIQTTGLCLQCHGNKEITNDVLARIQILYPNDKATGYTENQIRGLWVVEQRKR
jgi:hypothetical protein